MTATTGTPSLGLYIHIPFCVRKCFYCDFNSGPAQTGVRQAQLQALENEIRFSPWKGAAARTLFFGGGTPSELKLSELRALLAAIHHSFRLIEGAECSIECNPGTLSHSFLSGLRELGFNRISLGVQSFQDRHLRALGRIHNAQDARLAFAELRRAGFDNLNLDLMFALPGQTLQQWEEDLAEALRLSPEHLSLYNLTIEKDTEFGRRQALGLLSEADEDLAAAMYETSLEMTAAAGYEQYEISNFARPGYTCRHNLIYWRNEPYLGFGLSAASYLDGVRWSNTGNWEEYAAAAGTPPRAVLEQLEGRAALGEEIMLRLRTREGFSIREMSGKYGLPVDQELGDTIEYMLANGWLVRDEDRLRLTRSGTLVANSICAEFLVG